MKKISILGILAILVIVAEFAYAMIAGWVDMKNSFLEGYNSVNVHSGTPDSGDNHSAYSLYLIRY